MKSFRLIPFSVLILFAACGDDEVQPAPAAPSDAAKNVALTADPGAAIGVVAAKQGGPQERVVVEGRVHDLTKGFAIMKLMDTGLDYCGQVDHEDKCPTPWDYCCDSREVRIENSLLVEVRGADGKPLATPALPNMRLCDLVKVTGKLVKDEFDNLVLVADGLFQVERPTLPDYVQWPQ